MSSTATTAGGEGGPIPTLKLNDGNEIPVLAYGFGTANFAGQDDDMSKLGVMAIKNGYFHIDGAEIYANETGMGAGIKASGVPREKLYIVTKVVGTKGQDVQAALAASLGKLGVDYLDLYLVHIPYGAGSPEELQRIWAEMEAIKASGKSKSIGVSNFMEEDIEVILKTAKTIPAINQIEYHPYLQHGNLVNYLREKNIAVSAYSALTPLTAARPGPLDETYAELAKKYGVTESDIGLKWVIDQGIVAITTSRSEERLQGYIKKLFSFKLSEEDIKRITEIGKQKHYQGPGEAFMRARYSPK
ncbi:Aldo/keto reductase [Biscogniauxia mediterranea]|nr:Aldo/keto reductase [Biscogniauxia mediterranea]